ncbi:hypothetical protein QBC35DRAFT_497691 [Podospora australis]|uniref:2-nitropropane dioxygenase n=1 Tax=Podospora australis TaxID=1536484 RepID=A0AAN6WUV0_9PEZI|nr:hypothetical protein QBC35DRAFT_497691 [Podospora australis]
MFQLKLSPLRFPTLHRPGSSYRHFISAYYIKPTCIIRRKMSSVSQLKKDYPWVSNPLIIAAPMRVFTGPALAQAVSSAGGLGFIGPGLKPESTATDLASLGEKGEEVGVGFQLWNGDLAKAVEVVGEYKPCACWLFAPLNGQKDIDLWSAKLRAAHPGIKIWLQIGTVTEALAAATSSQPPDVLVVQGTEAGGHGRTSDGASWTTLLPEIEDTFSAKGLPQIPLVAAGGISDARGIAAALSVGASGAAIGTRFLASTEARIAKGYQNAVLEASEGGKNTVRTHLYNHLRGTYGWPEEQWAPRALKNKSWEEHEAGVPFEELRGKHEDALRKGDAAWGKETGRTATYAGEGVGLVRTVKSAKDIVVEERQKAREILRRMAGEFGDER